MNRLKCEKKKINLWPLYLRKIEIWKYCASLSIIQISVQIVYIDRVGVLVTLLTRIWEVLDSNLGRHIRYLEFFSFPQSLQADAGIILLWGHDPLPSRPFAYYCSLLSVRRYIV
jgi:hypothetical protein